MSLDKKDLIALIVGYNCSIFADLRGYTEYKISNNGNGDIFWDKDLLMRRSLEDLVKLFNICKESYL